MKIEPNGYIGQNAEYVLCEVGHIVLHDGGRIPLAELDRGENAFTQLCRSIDPAKCFIVAIIPNDADRDVFFKARNVAKGLGIHMQSPVATPEELREMWEGYKEMKGLRRVEGDSINEFPTSLSLEETP